MNRRMLTAAMALSVSLLAVPPVQAASLGFFHHTAADKSSAKAKISFQIRNDTKTALTISTGDQEMTVQPGRVIALKLQEGTQVTAVNGTGHIAAGAVLTTVTRDLQGNTLAVA